MAVMLLWGAAGVRAAEEAGNAAESTIDAGSTTDTAVPRLPREVRFSGVLQDGAGEALTGVQGVTFALYAEQEGGAPLWLESQTVSADEAGRYTVLLGAMRSDGLPQELFTSNEARWLGVQVSQPGMEEQARVLLVSVPYAMKAGDAETLGGLPASAYLLSGTGSSDGSSIAKSGLARAAASDVLPQAGSGTAGQIAKFDVDGTTLVNSILQENAGALDAATTLNTVPSDSYFARLQPTVAPGGRWGRGPSTICTSTPICRARR